jgi:CHAT domain-containing protein
MTMKRRLARYVTGVAALVLASTAFAAGPLSPEELFERGREAFHRGGFADAISDWTAAVAAYRKADKAAETYATLMHLAQAQARLGQYRTAVTSLDEARGLAERARDTRRTAAALAALGDIHIALGPPATAETLLKRGLELARSAGDAPTAAAALNSLGNLATMQKRPRDASAAYVEGLAFARQAGRRTLAATLLTNAARAQHASGDARAALASLDGAVTELAGPSPSHETASALVAVGVGYRDLGPALAPRAATVLGDALALARRLGDDRVESYAAGYMATLYEAEHRWQDALGLTRQAVLAAQRVGVPESLYRWQWQAGRLLAHLGARDDAIASYRRAVGTLQSIRSELSATYGAPPIPFREAIGPVYFELVDLLLQQAPVSPTPEQRDALLLEARDVVELFKAAELRDFFRDDCVDTALSKTTRLDVVSTTAAVVYPIILRDRLELLVTLPAGLKRVAVPVAAATLVEEVRAFRLRLEKRTTRQYLPHARKLYEWLVRPLEPELAAARIDTLVFVPDGALRTIPMAALHDGTGFLVAKYAIGITPGLQLTDPRPIRREGGRVLAAGVTEPVQGFPPLPSVSAEIEALRSLYPGTTLLDEQFRLPDLEKKLREETFSILHIASHGEFGDSADSTFLLAYDQKLTIDRLEQLVGTLKYRDEPLELLTLSACDTAAGDDRAALGLAGVAVKAGARSALATLWSVNDDASAGLIADFYRELREPSTSRAKALQRAQLKLLSDPRYEHPGFWSPFLLINNWL